MSGKNRYDLVHQEYSIRIEPHFCRKYECYGTDENHGYTWEEVAKEFMAARRIQAIEQLQLFAKEYNEEL